MIGVDTQEVVQPADPMTPIPCRVERFRRELNEVFTLELSPPPGFGFTPGQFNMLYQFGVGEVPISISGDPARPETLVHTIRAVGTVTGSMQALRRGATVGVRGPFGTPWPLEEAEGSDVVIVTGGLGLAPLRPVVCHVLANRPRYGRFILLYGARSPDEILFRRELEGWRGRLDTYVDVTVDHAAPEWSGNVGVVTKLIQRARFDPLHTRALVCGPEVMMRFAVQGLNAAGVADEQIWLSMERSMKCAVGFCGHCQFGPTFVCRDGPVFRYDRVARFLAVRDL